MNWGLGMKFQLRADSAGTSWDDYAPFNAAWESDHSFDAAKLIASRDYRANTEPSSLAEHLAFPVPLQRVAKFGIKIRSHQVDDREEAFEYDNFAVKEASVLVVQPDGGVQTTYSLKANDTNFNLCVTPVRSIFWITSEIHGGDQLVHAAKWLGRKTVGKVPKAITGQMWHGWLRGVTIEDRGLRKDSLIYLWGMHRGTRVGIAFTADETATSIAAKIISRAAAHRLAFEPGLADDARAVLEGVATYDHRKQPLKMVKKGVAVWAFPTLLNIEPASAMLGVQSIQQAQVAPPASPAASR